MSTAPSLEDRLAAEMRRSLLPHPFAPRRDLELASAICESEATCCFFDVLWPDEGRLALIAARVHRSGIGGALRAACLRSLARDALALGLAPDETVDLVRDLFAREVADAAADLALATLDTASGHIAHARHGRASVVMPKPGRNGVVLLACGDALVDPRWLPGDGGDLRVAAQRAAELCGPGSAVVGLLHRPRRRLDREWTFSMPNDLGAIAPLTARIEASLAAMGAPQAVGAAFSLALDELLTNVVSYGYPDGRRHEILLDLSVEREVAEVRLRDDGRPFDPLRLPEPDLEAGLEEREVGGLGVHFVRQMMDTVDYARETGWNVLRLRKRFVSEQYGLSPGHLP